MGATCLSLAFLRSDGITRRDPSAASASAGKLHALRMKHILSPSAPAYLSRIFSHLFLLLIPHTALQSHQMCSIQGTCMPRHASPLLHVLISLSETCSPSFLLIVKAPNSNHLLHEAVPSTPGPYSHPACPCEHLGNTLPVSCPCIGCPITIPILQVCTLQHREVK